LSACVAGRRGYHSVQIVEDLLHAPEAPAGERGLGQTCRWSGARCHARRCKREHKEKTAQPHGIALHSDRSLLYQSIRKACCYKEARRGDRSLGLAFFADEVADPVPAQPACQESHREAEADQHDPDETAIERSLPPTIPDEYRSLCAQPFRGKRILPAVL